MPTRRSSARPLTASVDLVIAARLGREFQVLMARRSARAEATVPSVGIDATHSLDAAATGLAIDTLGRPAAFLAQVRAIAAHAGGRAPTLTVVYVALTTRDADTDAAIPDDTEWAPLAHLPRIDAADREKIELAVLEIRRRVDLDPVAFALLPERFTLSELQQVYELLLGHRLHKASFRRALLAADLVQATDEWRGEARGRPAQLFRHAPRRRRGARRALRFDLLGT